MPKIFISNYVSSNYENALSSCGFKFSYECFDECDGLLLPGGGDIAPCLYGEANEASYNIKLKLDIFELFLIRKFLSRNKPILGICRGMQVINTFFDGTLTQDMKGHSGNKDIQTPCKFYGEFKNCYGEKDYVNCNHHQAIKKLGKNLKIGAISSDNIIEAVYSNKIIATQFHPERSNNLAVFKLFLKMFNYD